MTKQRLRHSFFPTESAVFCETESLRRLCRPMGEKMEMVLPCFEYILWGQGDTLACFSSGSSNVVCLPILSEAH